MKLVRIGMLWAAMVGMLLGAPAQSFAFGGFFKSWCLSKHCSTPTFAASPCAPQVASYVPQTCYREQVVQMPVTTFRPVTSCDPCSGCPVTCMKPVTTMVQSVQKVPYTTYRLVLTNPCGNSCTTAMCQRLQGTTGLQGTTMATTTAAMAPTSTSGCSSCASAPAAAAAGTTYYAPSLSGSTSTFAPESGYPASDSSALSYESAMPPSSTNYHYHTQPTQSGAAQPGTAQSGTAQPGPTVAEPQRTFENGNAAQPEPRTDLRPIPLNGSGHESSPGAYPNNGTYNNGTYDNHNHNGTSPAATEQPMGNTSVAPMSSPRLIDAENRTTSSRDGSLNHYNSVVLSQPAIGANEPGETYQPVRQQLAHQQAIPAWQTAPAPQALAAQQSSDSQWQAASAQTLAERSAWSTAAAPGYVTTAAAPVHTLTAQSGRVVSAQYAAPVSAAPVSDHDGWRASNR